MATLVVDTGTSIYMDCMLIVDKYETDGSMFVKIWSREKGLIATITECLNQPNLAEDEAYVDYDNYPWVIEFLESNEIAEVVGVKIKDNIHHYPLVKFYKDKIAKFEREM